MICILADEAKWRKNIWVGCSQLTIIDSLAIHNRSSYNQSAIIHIIKRQNTTITRWVLPNPKQNSSHLIVPLTTEQNPNQYKSIPIIACYCSLIAASWIVCRANIDNGATIIWKRVSYWKVICAMEKCIRNRYPHRMRRKHFIKANWKRYNSRRMNRCTESI